MAGIKNQKDWSDKLNYCLDKIKANRDLFELNPFDEFQWTLLNEPRYDGVPVHAFSSTGWNRALLDLYNLKTWLDRGGDVSLKHE